jgi:hypothetical protein
MIYHITIPIPNVGPFLQQYPSLRRSTHETGFEKNMSIYRTVIYNNLKAAEN